MSIYGHAGSSLAYLKLLTRQKQKDGWGQEGGGGGLGHKGSKIVHPIWEFFKPYMYLLHGLRDVKGESQSLLMPRVNTKDNNATDRK